MTFADVLKEKFNNANSARVQSARITSTKLKALPSPEPVQMAEPGTWDPFADSKLRAFERNVALVTGEYGAVTDANNSHLASSAMSDTIKSNSEKSRSKRMITKPQDDGAERKPFLDRLREQGFQ